MNPFSVLKDITVYQVNPSSVVGGVVNQIQRLWVLFSPRLKIFSFPCVVSHCLKPATHLAILYADRFDRHKLPGVPGAVIVIFADRQYIYHVRYR